MNDRIQTQVILLHSNDIHSRLEQAAKIAAIIAEERRIYGSDRVLAVDCGDHMDRMRQETEGSDGAVNVKLLNEAGYEAITLGNNEGLTYSLATLAEAYRDQASFAVICANMKESATGERPEWLVPNTIVVKNGLRIGLIGVTANFVEFYRMLGWNTTDPLEAVREQAAFLQGKADVIIVMSHIGLPLDRRMAEEIDGIDLILGAHTHHLLEEPLLIGGTTICAAGKFGEYVGRVEIGIDPVTSRPVFRAMCVPTSAYEEQSEAAAIISDYRASGQQRLGRVITRLSEPLPARAERESQLGNLLAIGLRRWANAEIGMVNAGQLLGGLAIGDVTAGELHALCPSPINPCLMRIAGHYLRTALEQSLLPEYMDKRIKGYGFRGEVLGVLSVDGMTLTYDSARPPMHKLINIEVNGEPFSDERIYTVGSIDMFSFKTGYESLASAEAFDFYLPEFIRDVLERELQNSSSLKDCRTWRWHNIAVRRQ